MRNRLLLISIAAILTAPVALYAQTPAAKPAFDVASVRPSPAPDMQKMMADLQVGKKPESAHVEGSRAAYTYMSLKQLIAYAYKMRAYEINGPDWLVTDRFDIVARLPEGASKDAAPDMCAHCWKTGSDSRSIARSRTSRCWRWWLRREDRS
jgi:hypothetical protein